MARHGMERRKLHNEIRNKCKQTKGKCSDVQRMNINDKRNMHKNKGSNKTEDMLINRLHKIQ